MYRITAPKAVMERRGGFETRPKLAIISAL